MGVNSTPEPSLAVKKCAVVPLDSLGKVDCMKGAEGVADEVRRSGIRANPYRA